MMDIMELIDKYWDIAYREGYESRSTDTENGDAGKIRSQLESRISAMQELCDIVSDLDNIIPDNRDKLIKAIKKYQENIK